MKQLLFLWIFSNSMISNSCNTIQVNNSTEVESTNLHYLVREQKNPKSKAPVLILLHGYGSNENDLFSLAKKIPNNWLVVSVRAPISVADSKFKWYDVKMVNQKITMNFDDEEKSRQALLKLVDQIISKYNVDKNKIITAGFSQGANMAVGLFLTAPNKVLAAGCFSGRFMEEIKPLIKDQKTLKSKQVFIAHGTRDNMLPLQYAEENKTILESYGIKVKFSTDEVAHSISAKQLNDFVAWIQIL